MTPHHILSDPWGDLVAFCQAHGLDFEERGAGEVGETGGDGDSTQDWPRQFTIDMGGVGDGKVVSSGYASNTMKEEGVGGGEGRE